MGIADYELSVNPETIVILHSSWIRVGGDEAAQAELELANERLKRAYSELDPLILDDLEYQTQRWSECSLLASRARRAW